MKNIDYDIGTMERESARKDLKELAKIRALKFRLFELITKITITKNADPEIVKDIQSWNVNPELVITK